MTTIHNSQSITYSGLCRAIFSAALLLTGFIVMPSASPAADYPEAEISNGLVTAKIYLPDAENGFYRSTRFDWSGAVYSLQYEGHEFYGQWIDRIDPEIVNWEFQGDEIVSGLCSGLNGPVNEFVTPLGWDESETDGTFIKLGIGVLRKSPGRYNQYKHYEVLNPGIWTVKKERDSVEFTQELTDTSSGYAYIYSKTVRLIDGKPVMEIAQSLRNTGNRPIQNSVYNHNFVKIDGYGAGPDYTIRTPFIIRQGEGDNRGPVEFRGNEIVFPRPLAGEDEIVLFIEGYGDTAKDNVLIFENANAGAGMRITGDRPLAMELLWSIRSVVTVETFVAFDIQPGDEFTWKNTIEYYEIPSKK